MENINFEEIKQKVLPYFIKYYGEEYKDLIIYRMNQTEPIFYTNIQANINTDNEEFSKLKDKIYDKYMIKFLESVKHYLDNNDNEILTKCLSDKVENWNLYKRKFNILKLVGYDLYCRIASQEFLKQYEKFLKSDKTEQMGILDCLKKYYISLGFEQNIITDQFLFGDKNMENILPPKIIDKLLKIKNNYKELADKELLKIINNYDILFERIKKLNLVDEDKFEEDTIETINQNINCCTNHASIINNKVQNVTLLYFCIDTCSNEDIDIFLIHEINHAIESSLICYNGTSIYKSGFEYLANGQRINNKYEQLSENINHRIAREITKLMHDDNVYLFTTLGVYPKKINSLYEYQNELTDYLWKTFKKDIIKSRLDTTLDDLFNIVDQDEFDELSRLVDEHFISYNKPNQLNRNREDIKKDAQKVLSKIIRRQTVIY